MTDIYTDGAPAADQQPVAVTPPAADVQIPDEVLEFVGEGKKYATLQDALKSVPNAQKHIATLEKELQQLREAQGTALTQEEVVSAVEAYLKQQGTPPAGLDQAGVTALIDRQLSARKAAEAATENVTAFKASMTQKFGDKQAEVFTAKATELGLTPEKLSDLVRTSPKAALQLFGLDGKGVNGTPAPSGLNTEALHNHQPQNGEGLKSFRGVTTKALQAEYRRVEAAIKQKHGLA